MEGEELSNGGTEGATCKMTMDRIHRTCIKMGRMVAFFFRRTRDEICFVWPADGRGERMCV